MNGSIVWLASYPKSGNTWLRIFLTNYLRDADSPADINDLDGEPLASARPPLDEALGYDSAELTHDEIDRLRPELYSYMASRSRQPLFCKVHDAYTLLPDGRPLFPAQATRAVLYLVRNPLDVCVSFSYHSGHQDHCRSSERMANEQHCFCDSTRRQEYQLRQRLLSWSSHVRSWIGAAGARTLVLRYEDMQMDTQRTFGAAVRFAGLEFCEQRLRKAIDFSSFTELRRQEQEHGFREKAPCADAFFRQGHVGSWRQVLAEDTVQRLITDHAGMMRRFGYLDAHGAPVF